MDAIFAVLIGFFGFIIAFLPSVISSKRGHRNHWAIVICNIIGLFTGIFYLVALVWAFTDNKGN